MTLDTLRGKVMFARFFTIIGLSFAVALSSGVASAKKVKVKMGTVAPEGTPWEQQAKEIAKKVTKASAGRIKYKFYWGGAKGDEQAILKKVIKNKLQMSGISTAALGTVIPELDVLDLPFLWDSAEEADFVLDNHLTKFVEGLMEAQGLVLYQWAENGWQGMGSTDKAVKSPGDMGGVKVRSQDSPVHTGLWKALGSAPVVMEISEVQGKLEKGEITVAAQTPLYTFAAGWQAFVKHYTLTRHVYQTALIMYSKKFFDAQEPDIKSALMTERQEGASLGRKLVRQLEPQLIGNFTSYGIEVVKLSDAERNAFKKATAGVRAEYEKQATAKARELLKLVDKGKAAYK